MKKSHLVMGVLAGAALLAAGLAIADPSSSPDLAAGQPMRHGMSSRGMADLGEAGHGRGMGHGMMGSMGPGMMHGAQMGDGRMGHGGEGQAGLGQGAAFDETRLDDLKVQLGITAVQEAAWSRYVDAVREAASADVTARAGGDTGTVDRLSPQERFAYGSRLREANQASAEKLRTAAGELLATLDTTQRVTAETILPGLGSPGRRGPMQDADAGRGSMHGGHGHGMHGQN